jgi:hypothetical protein
VAVHVTKRYVLARQDFCVYIIYNHNIPCISLTWIVLSLKLGAKAKAWKRCGVKECPKIQTQFHTKWISIIFTNIIGVSHNTSMIQLKSHLKPFKQYLDDKMEFRHMNINCQCNSKYIGLRNMFSFTSIFLILFELLSSIKVDSCANS